MLIYQDVYKNAEAAYYGNSKSRDLKPSTPTLNIRNINFLRGLGFKVKRKAAKNE